MGPVLTLAQAGCVPPTAEDNDVGNLGSELAEAAVATAPTVRSLVVRWIPESGRPADDDHVDVARLRKWCREGRKLAIGYLDETGTTSDRVIRPFMVGYVETVRVIMAWCELRQDFRVFRTDRLTTVAFLEQRYPDRSVALRRRWLKMMRERRAGGPFPG